MFDKLWWLMNRKPSKVYVPYIAGVWVGFLCGVLTILGIIVFTLYWWLGAIVLAYAVGWPILCYFYDKKNGYVDACYQAYLQHRERIGKKLGKL